MTADANGDHDAPDPGAGLASQVDAPSEAVAELYDTWAADGSYDRDVEQWGYEAPERIADAAVAALARVSGPVLDAGCGTGRVGRALAARGVTNVVGGDFTAASIEAARELGVYSELAHLDLNGPLDFDDGRFAVTASAGVFTYVDDTEATLRELLRIVRPGGSVLFTQRTDLWVRRGCPAILARLIERRACTASVSDPMPYLPGHPDFGTSILIRYVTLVNTPLRTGR